jgi:hypothetical protein
MDRAAEANENSNWQRGCLLMSAEDKLSKNAITIEHLKIACRHVEEMMAAGVTENLSIRTLELFADVYAKLHKGGSATPHHVDQVALWSVAARRRRNTDPNLKPQECFRVEHGTPRRAFARKIFMVYQKHALSKRTMNALVERYWKLAVITLEEDQLLNKLARSKMFESPDERWKAAKIKFSLD